MQVVRSGNGLGNSRQTNSLSPVPDQTLATPISFSAHDLIRELSDGKEFYGLSDNITELLKRVSPLVLIATKGKEPCRLRPN